MYGEEAEPRKQRAIWDCAKALNEPRDRDTTLAAAGYVSRNTI